MSMISNFGNLGQGTGDTIAQQSAKQPDEALRESFSQPSNVSIASQDGSTIAGAYNRGAGSGINRFKQTQLQGDILGTQGIQPYDSQSSAQSMNVKPMFNNGLGSLGKNNTGGTGFSSGLDNSLTAQKSNGLGSIGYNPQGNNYNIIGGVELI